MADKRFVDIYAYLALMHKLMLNGHNSVRDCARIELLMAFLKELDESEREMFYDSSWAFAKAVKEKYMDELTRKIDSEAWGWRDKLNSRQFLAALSLLDGFWLEVPDEDKCVAIEELRFTNTMYACANNLYAKIIAGKMLESWANRLMNQAYANVESTLAPQPAWRPKSGIPYTDIGEDFRTVRAVRISLKLDTPRWPINLAKKIRGCLRFGEQGSYDSFDNRNEDVLGLLYGILRYAHNAVTKSRPEVGHFAAVYLLLEFHRCADDWRKELEIDDNLKAELENVVANASAIIEHTRHLISPKMAEALKNSYKELNLPYQ